MRGKVYRIGQLKCINGITPAHAGKRHFRYAADGHFQDHPRPCGEKLEIAFLS